MVENDNAVGGGADGGGAQEPGRAGTLPRLTLTLPPRSSLAGLFHEGGGAGGSAAEASPGPLTLVSSFFAEDPDSDCRSFTQLLAGAMNSPVVAAATTRWSAGAPDKEGAGGGAAAESGGGGMARLGQSRPPSLAVCRPQLLTVPPGLSPTSLLDSPAFFSSGLGNFGMSHQEALAQVTAQAELSPFKLLCPIEFPSPLFKTATDTLSQQPTQELPTLQSNNMAFGSAEESQSDQISQPAGIITNKPANDGYSWRKYGQKMVKGCEFPRSYYKCTHPNCPVTKKLERSEDGQVTEVIYKGQHNHPRPTPNRRSKEGGIMPSGSNEINGNNGNPNISETGPGHLGNLKKQNHTAPPGTFSRRDEELGYGTSELSGSSDSEEVAEIKADEGDESEPDHKRRNISASSQRTLTEPRIIVQTTSEVDLLDDGYRWRKYGQKVVKGNPNPRSYYKCTFSGCNVRKHIERSATDSKAVITTYEGKHSHDVPAARNSSHNLVGAVLAPHTIRPSQTSLGSVNFNNNDLPVGVLQFKEEHEIT